MEKKVCIAMYVYGEQYQWYVPLFLYFLKNAYPEYHCVVAFKTRISAEVYSSIRLLDYGNFKIYENVFSDHPYHKGLPSFERWVMYFEDFERFDYVYIGDIDIMISRENPALMDRHIEICKKYGLIYSNTFDVPERGRRMSGINFVERKPYFEKMLPVMKKYEHKLRFGQEIQEFYNPQFKCSDNQFAIRVMMEEAGIKIDETAKNYNNTFQYGGIHLGHSRCAGRWEMFLQKDQSQIDYFKRFCKSLFDKVFWELYFRSPVEIQREFDEVINAGRKHICAKYNCGVLE